MKKVFFKTFGCRTNIYDTALMQQSLQDFEIVLNENEADCIVVNSCTVTNSADSNVRSYINKITPLGKKIILAGCGAISKGTQLYQSNKIDGVLGHSEKLKLGYFLQHNDRFFQKGDLQSIDTEIVKDFSQKTKAFVKIQEGCDFECSYCIIPSVRGKARSLKEQTILEQIQILSQNGYKEFVLTGTNIGSYGKDTNSSLAQLLQKIGAISGIKRIRLGSLEPVQIDEAFFEILDEPWMERHLHIALQHTSKRMLQIMRRRNNLNRDIELFSKLASRGFALGSDFIVGHPGESEEIFEEAYTNLLEFPLTHIHLFPFSKRDGTHSATLKQTVSKNIAKQRLAKIENLISNNNYQFRKNLTQSLSVLVEEYKNGHYIGYDQYFNHLNISSSSDITKSWVEIKEYSVQKERNYATFETQ